MHPPQRLLDETHDSSVDGSTADQIVSYIRTVPVTAERKPYIQPDHDLVLPHAGIFLQGSSTRLRSPILLAGTPRANIAATHESPIGTTEEGWAERHCNQSDHDGIIFPTDTFRGFHKLGFGILLSLLAVFIIHSNFSYPTLPTCIPDPFFRIYVHNIHKDKHGSDSGTYDTEGRFVPQKFEDMFSKYAEGKDSLTIWDVSKLLKGQRLIADPVGWGGAFFEWLATYIMLWPEDGRMKKEDIRGIYDGSIFYTIAARRAKNEPASSGDVARMKRRQ
nr:hypothetical protein LTR18_002341 [Exophiala xenobiotica]